MTKRSILFTAVAAVALLGGQAFAGTPAKTTVGKTMKETVAESCITGDLGFDITNAYYFHGIRQEDSGFIIQPYSDLYFKVYEGSGMLTKLSVDVGIWNSFHSNKTTASSTNNWYEFDFLAGLTATLAERWSLGVKWVAYTSPGDYFGNAYAINLRLGYDDSDLLGAFSLQPYVAVEFEVDGKSANGSDEGIYYEVGITPNHSWGNFNLALPLRGGFGSHDYYAGNHGYGFFSVGLAATYNMTFIPECLGQWSLGASATYMNLGDGTSVSNGGDENEFIYTGGLKVAF